MLSDLFLEMFGLSLTAPQSSDDKLRACADDQHSQSGKEAQTNLVDMQNGEIENLDAGKHGFIRRGEVNLRLMEHIEDAMRGGEIFIKGSVGYRAGIHMKEYNQKRPALVIGGSAGSFLGEYQAGGVIIVLGLGSRGPIVGNFCGTGMHGGEIFLRAELFEGALPKQVCARKAQKEDLARIEGYIRSFCGYFDYSFSEVFQHEFLVLSPNTGNPYRQLYTPN